jgi:serine protease AprX
MHRYVLQRGPITLLLMAVIAALATGSMASLAPATPANTAQSAYIVQAETAARAAAAVEQAGGSITHELDIINGVAALLPPAGRAHLQANPRLTLHPDTTVQTAYDDQAWWETDTAGYQLYPSTAINVHYLHEHAEVWSPNSKCQNGSITVADDWSNWSIKPHRGAGVTVAVVDSGLLPMASNSDWTTTGDGTLYAENSGRCIIYRDFVDPTSPTNSIDGNGHGTHIAATIADNREDQLHPWMNDTPVGVAPDANLLVARALNADGSGSYANVIAAIDWIVDHKDEYAIRVLNLSLYAPVTGFYWQDPLNQAVMRAWQAGIVVVTVAGNDGPDAGTITAPGNVPYVITVGALTSGRYTDSGRDELADYSGRGPTESAFVKPDLLVPATGTIAAMPSDSYLAGKIGSAGIVSNKSVDFAVGSFGDHNAYYKLSGTSMAAAQVSGVVALMLQPNPNLSPDQVKYRLLSTTRPAFDDLAGEPLYTVWEQGAGLIDARRAITNGTLDAANVGMDIALDLEPNNSEHYWGYTIWDETSGEFRLIATDTGDAIEVWQGGRRSHAGSEWLWSSGRRSHAGNAETWAGGRRSHAGSLLWAGSDMPWLQADLQSVGSLNSEVVLNPDWNEETATNQPAEMNHTVWLPLVRN